MRPLAVFVPVLAACAPQVETNAIMLRPPAARTRGVEVYVQGQAPQRAFYELGLVQAEAFGSEPNPEEMVKALTRRGAELGCEALLRVQIDVGYTRAHAVGVCVRWLEAAPPGEAPRPPPTFEPPDRRVPKFQETPAPRPVEPPPSSISPGTGV